jgi:hypothetical protein
MQEINVVFLMLPPIRKFPQPPAHQAGCVEHICPLCKKEAWISAKKRALWLHVDCFVACYDCIEKQTGTQKNFFKSDGGKKI